MSKIDKPPTIEGLRHSRNLIAKQWEKEKQRAADLKKRIDVVVTERNLLRGDNALAQKVINKLQGEIEILKRKLKFISKRYGA